ncbi:hypothetical protein BDN72DRAFT_778013, partial [Pluteus cervinus]
MDPQSLLNEFRQKYHNFVNKIHDLTSSPTDTVVLDRLHDDVVHFSALVQEHGHIFPEQELEVLQQNLRVMAQDVRMFHSTMSESSHQGCPVILEYIHTGGRGRPTIRINRDFLAWAIQLRGVSGIARFLGIGRKTVRKALVEYGLRGAEECPLPFRQDVHEAQGPRYTSLQADISDEMLDSTIMEIRATYERAGLSIWGIVVHGIIDGYSRLITGLKAHDNNKGKTVLELFFQA